MFQDELSNLLGKVKEVINENEGLHEKEKTGLLKSVFNCFESEDDENHEMDDGKVSSSLKVYCFHSSILTEVSM